MIQLFRFVGRVTNQTESSKEVRLLKSKSSHDCVLVSFRLLELVGDLLSFIMA